MEKLNSVQTPQESLPLTGSVCCTFGFPTDLFTGWEESRLAAALSPSHPRAPGDLSQDGFTWDGQGTGHEHNTFLFSQSEAGKGIIQSETSDITNPRSTISLLSLICGLRAHDPVLGVSKKKQRGM